MDEKGKNGGTAVSPAPAESAQQLLDRLTEAAARLQERDARQQAQRLEALQHQIEASSQELETARLHTAQGEEAQQSLQQQLTEAEQRLMDTQNRLKSLHETLRALRQQDAAAQAKITALEEISARTDESLQAAVEAFRPLHEDWVEKLETLAEDLHTDQQTMQGLKRSNFLLNEAAWEEINGKLCALSQEADSLRASLGCAPAASV